MSFRYFTLDEFKCQETGENEIKEEFVTALDALRDECGFPFRITSGYRSPRHSIEAKKKKPGQHSQGIACDIAVSGGSQRIILVENALKLGFSGVGIAKTFIHVDIRTTPKMMWCYQMAKITIDGLEPNQVLTVSLHELMYEGSDDNDPEEDIPEEEARIANLVGLPKRSA